MAADMFRLNTKTGKSTLDGGADRGIPLVKPENEEDWIEDLREFSDRDFGNDEDEGPDRRRDPLR